MLSTAFDDGAALEGALLHVRSDLGAFAITGSERLSWLNGLVTQEVAKLLSGAGAYALAVGKTGKIMAELWLLAGAEWVTVVAARDRIEMLREHFDKHLIMEDAEIGAPLDRGVIFAHGLRPTTGAPRDRVAEARALGGDAARVDWTGRGDAAVILAPEGRLDATVTALLASDGADSSASPALATEASWEALRIAWGLPRFGVDYDDQSLPQEASLETLAVSFSKGCYLGQETVFMVEKRGHPKKKLVRLAVEGDAALCAGTEIMLREGGAVGTVTSATPAPEGGSLAIGSVKYKHAVAETALLAGGHAARVLGLAGRTQSA
jgi:folate-binding protein YgfZ